MCIMAVTAIAGGVLQGIAGARAADAEAEAADQRAELHERQSTLERTAGAFEASQIRREGRQVVGDQVANTIASGIAPTSGSSAAVIQDTSSQIDLDADLVLFGAERRAENETLQAKFARREASSARASKGLRFLSPIVGAAAQQGSSIAGAFGS